MQPYHSSKVKTTVNVAWFLFLRIPFILAVCAGSLCRKASLRCHACCSIVTLIILAVLDGSALSAGGCTTRTRTCPTSRRSPTSEVSAWRRSSSVTATARHMCSTWRAKVKTTRCAPCPPCWPEIVSVCTCKCLCPLCCRFLLWICAKGGSQGATHL